MTEDRRSTPPAKATTDSVNWHATAEEQYTQQLASYLDFMSATPFMARITEQTLAMLRLTSGLHVLEVGCGTGVFLPILAAGVGPAGHIEAIDHSPQFVAAAQERIQAARLTKVVTVRDADAHALPFPDATFDAAHCERVLMHLDDPTAVLREMRRVVKPGGRVVAAETHYAGVQIDHPDHEAMELLFQRHVARTTRQPHMGLTLNRRMHEAGLVGREAVPVMDWSMTYRTLHSYGFDPTETAALLVEEGAVSRERMDAVLAYLETASDAGSYWYYGAAVVAAGDVP